MIGSRTMCYYVEWEELQETAGACNVPGDGWVCDVRAESHAFRTLDEARAWAGEQAAADKVTVRVRTHRGNGSICRNVYRVCSVQCFDHEGRKIYFRCRYDSGSLCCEADYELIDVLDFHPEVKRAFERAGCEYALCREGLQPDFIGFDDALGRELGEGWEDLDFIDCKYE